jgi:hypothetical protein
MRVTVLAPGDAELATLRPVWEREVRDAGLEPGTPYSEEEAIPTTVAALGPPPTRDDVERWAATPFSRDGSEANGASVSLLLEFEGRSALLTGDAHSDPLVRGVDRLLEARGSDRLDIDVFKLPHHGSRRNVSSELLERVHAGAPVLVVPMRTSDLRPSPESRSRPRMHGCASTTRTRWGSGANLRSTKSDAIRPSGRGSTSGEGSSC